MLQWLMAGILWLTTSVEEVGPTPWVGLFVMSLAARIWNVGRANQLEGFHLVGVGDD